MSDAGSVIPLGARASVAKAGAGTVRFVGQTAFAQGKWCGIELDNKVGKNDGSVQGTRYFSCADGHGMFVRPSQVKIIEDAPAPVTAVSLRAFLLCRFRLLLLYVWPD
jgi:dynactin 1